MNRCISGRKAGGVLHSVIHHGYTFMHTTVVSVLLLSQLANDHAFPTCITPMSSDKIITLNEEFVATFHCSSDPLLRMLIFLAERRQDRYSNFQTMLS